MPGGCWDAANEYEVFARASFFHKPVGFDMTAEADGAMGARAWPPDGRAPCCGPGLCGVVEADMALGVVQVDKPLESQATPLKEVCWVLVRNSMRFWGHNSLQREKMWRETTSTGRSGQKCRRSVHERDARFHFGIHIFIHSFILWRLLPPPGQE